MLYIYCSNSGHPQILISSYYLHSDTRFFVVKSTFNIKIEIVDPIPEYIKYIESKFIHG